MAKNKQSIRNKIWFILTIFFSLVYIIWRIFFTIPFGFGVVSLIAGLALIIIEILGLLEAAVHYYNMDKIESHPLPAVPPERFPDVDIFIATYNEPVDLLYKTINGCNYLDYPDKNKVHIYLCDDGNRLEMNELAIEMGVNYLNREDNKGAKAGNLNNALLHSSSPLIVTLDADMIPKHDFLMRTIPYFVDFDIQNEGKEEKDRKKLGFVQTPQSFYNPDLFQFNLFSENRIPNEQDYFYQDIQITRNKTNSVIYGDSNTVLLRSAIEEIGGFYTKSITEDYATGILLQKNGYICYAINEILASGLSATDLKSLIQQRIRWARGVISTSRKMHILISPKLSFGQKMNYWASTWYWYAPIKRLVYIMSPILFGAFGYTVLKCTLLEILIFWLPMYISSSVLLKIMSQNIRNVRWTSIYETILFPFMLFPIIFETFGIRLKNFSVTEKGEATNEKGKNILYMIPFAILIGLSLFAIFNCVSMIFESNSLNPTVVLFWLFNNLFILVMALFFLLGRTLYRKKERVAAEEDCLLKTATSQFACKTRDLSEKGVSVITDQLIYIDENEIVEIGIKTLRYDVTLKGKIVHMGSVENQHWKLAFVLTDMNGFYNDYLQIIYDRVPGLPNSLIDSSNSIDDLNINIKKRSQKTVFENRKLPRILISENLDTENEDKLYVENFNYKYIVLNTEKNLSEVTLYTANGLKLRCLYQRTIKGNSQLFEVKNYQQILQNETERILLEDWLGQIIKKDERLKLETNTEKGKGKSELREQTEMDLL